MKRAMITLTALGFGIFGPLAWSAENQATQLKDKREKLGYSVGIDIGKSVNKQKIDLEPNAFFAGFKDGTANKTSLMSEDEIRQTLLSLQTELVERQKAENKIIADKNLIEGEKFLAENKKRKGVVTLPSGLEYRIIKQGSGDSPKPTDVVVVNYRGKLINGTEFDSSYTRGEPVKLTVNGVIPGWTEALQLMKPGAKWELFIPAKLAYGEHGAGQIIGPNSTLIFDVDLLSVEKPNTTPNTETK